MVGQPESQSHARLDGGVLVPRKSVLLTGASLFSPKSRIPIHERVELPESWIPADSRVEIDAKITAGK